MFVGIFSILEKLQVTTLLTTIYIISMVKFDRFQLDNGLQVIVNRDTSTPIVAMNILYKVGSRDESVRRTGFAHLFEHLMFGGSENIPKYDVPLEKAGGENNAFTNADFTNYYLTIPKNNLEIAFWLESDRMNKLTISESALSTQRQVVIEEFKQNYLNQPYGDIYLLLKPLAYKKHPYRWITIGKNINHIEKASLQYVKNFYDNYYKPDNAILSISGDVSTEDVKILANKWFGSIKPGNKIINSYPEEPEQTRARTLTVERDVPQDAVIMAWHMPRRTDLEFYNYDLISDILSNGKSSRLYRKLVMEKNMFSEINAFVSGDMDQGLFMIVAKLLDGISTKEAIKAINAELDLIKNNLVSPDELTKVKNKIESSLMFSQSSVLSKAMNLGYFEMLGDAEEINNEFESYQNVTQQSIMESAQKVFNPEKQNTLIYNRIHKQA